MLLAGFGGVRSFIHRLAARMKSSTIPSFPSPTFFKMAAFAAAGMDSIDVSSSTRSNVPLVSTLKSRCLPLSMVSTSY